MKRALTLRKIQLLESLKYALIFAIALCAFGLILGLLLGGPQDVFAFKGFFDIYDLVVLVMLMVVFLTFLIPISDGVSYFDSALRLGIGRRDYFLINLPIYLVIAGLNLYLVKVIDISQYNSQVNAFLVAFQQLSWESYLSILMRMLFYAVIAYSFYKIGWKILIPLILIPVVSGLSTAILASEQVQLLDFTKIINIVKFFNSHLTTIYMIGTLLLIALYYCFINKFEVQN